MRRHAILIVAASLVAAIAGAQPPAFPGAGAAATFETRTIAGEKLSLSELLAEGPVVLDFWATWCKPCLTSLPELEKLSRKHRERGLRVVAISIDGPRNFSKVRLFANKLGLTMPLVIDRDERLQQLYQVKAAPTTFLIGKDGRIAWHRQGYLPGDAEALERALESVLVVPESAAP
jgi:peroxiredoxin